jgi:hypothetical protein
MFLRALFKELKELWHWVYAYDSHLKCRFNLRVAYQWLIHDYLAHDIFSVDVSMVDSIVQYVSLMHLGSNTTRKSLSLIVIEVSFPLIALS